MAAPVSDPPTSSEPPSIDPSSDLPSQPQSGSASHPAGEPRWLELGQQQTWRAFLEATRVFFDRIESQLQRDAGMPHGYYEILVRLSESPGRALRMSQLADRLLSSRSRLSHAVSRLEEAGWVRRESSPGDRRGWQAVLTDAGFAALAAAAPGHVEAVRANLFDKLSQDQVRALREISEALLRDP
jgi:DNA-binding MarR family transcriptional regulator